jgi:hypothetical protein
MRMTTATDTLKRPASAAQEPLVFAPGWYVHHLTITDPGAVVYNETF